MDRVSQARGNVLLMGVSAKHTVSIATRCLSGVDAMAISSSRRFPRHSHDQFGIGVMRRGGHRSWSSVGSVEAGPGDVIAVNPHEVHDGIPVSEHRAWCMIFIDPAVVSAWVEEEAASREIGFAVRRAPEIARTAMRAIDALRFGDAAEAEEVLTNLFDALLTRSSRHSGDTAPSPATRRALQRIHDCPASPPSLDEIAAVMGMSRTTALRRFRQEAGATPHDHSMHYRLRLARHAIEDGIALAEIASDLGFADQSHMTRAFSRQFGLSPGRYQRACVTPSARNILQDR